MDSELDFHELPTSAAGLLADVLHYPDVLPDGKAIWVSGDPEGFKRFNHLQGDNPYGFQGTCGLVSCEDVLRQFGVEVTEADVVGHAIRHGLCVTDGDPASCGGTTVADQVQILKDYGVPAHYEVERSLADLGEFVEHGHGIIIGVNAGILWNDAAYFGDGSANHAIVVTGMAREIATGQIAGFYINDSGVPQSGRFVDAETMQQAWVDAGGSCVVTDSTHR
jgi:hypothetical protein